MLSRNLRVSLIETDTVWADKQANLDQLEKSLDLVPDRTDLVVLPEMFSTGSIVDDRNAAAMVAERNIDDTITRIRKIASSRNMALAGTFLAHTASQLYNRAFFIEPDGDETFYDKRHLFTFGGEPKVFKHGFKAAPVVRFRGMNIKLVTCYDVRFPVFCRNVQNSYDIMIVMANWPASRQSAWKSLLLARAIENEAYVCGVNRRGTDAYGTDYGNSSSFIIDYKGGIVNQSSTEQPIVAADLSLTALTRFRSHFPVWQDADAFTLKI